MKQVFTAAVAAVIREAQLTGGVQMKKTREGRRTLKSHIGQPLWKFVMWLKKIIQDQRIMKLSDSCEMYVSALEETKHSKPGYKAEKLKKKLEKSDTYGQTLPFCSLNSWGKFKLYIVYNTDVSTDRAVTLAYELGSTSMVHDVALYLRKLIAEAF